MKNAQKNDFFRDVICLLKDFEWLSHFVDASASSEYDNNQIMRMWGQAIAHIKSQELPSYSVDFTTKI